MKIVELRMRRYRAFDGDVSIPLSSFTVLTGPNNLGKSTVLMALNALFIAVQGERYSRARDSGRYDFADDYPKQFIGRPGRRINTLLGCTMEFSAEDQELANLQYQVNLPTSLQVTVEFIRDNRVDRFFPKIDCDGLEGEKKNAFLSWFSSNFRYVYIPAVRDITGRRSSIYSELFDGAIRTIKQSRQRVQQLEKFYADVKKRISDVSGSLAQELQAYLPNVKSVEFVLDELDIMSLVNVRDVEIDDGVKTSLKHKGDGIKNLFAISMLQYIAKQRFGKNLIFGIEEPETHLHSSAIYDLKETLRALSHHFQVLLTTHSAILVQRDAVSSNIVISQKATAGFSTIASPANNLREIQRSLGIRPQDNMSTAEIVVVVEGPTEEIVLPMLLMRVMPELGKAFETGRIRVLPAHSAANVPALVRALARDAAGALLLLDSDKEGKIAAEKVRSSGLIDPRDLFEVPPRVGCIETEFEDLFEPDLYLSEVAASTGIAITRDEFNRDREKTGGQKDRMKKWSDVMKVVMSKRGKDWEHVRELARESFAKTIRKKYEEISMQDLEWAKGLASRAQEYLKQRG